MEDGYEDGALAIPINETYPLLYTSDGDRGFGYVAYSLKNNTTNEETDICAIDGEGILGDMYVVKGNKLYIGIGEIYDEQAYYVIEVNLCTLHIRRHTKTIHESDDFSEEELNNKIKNYMTDVAQVAWEDIKHIQNYY